MVYWSIPKSSTRSNSLSSAGFNPKPSTSPNMLATGSSPISSNGLNFKNNAVLDWCFYHTNLDSKELLIWVSHRFWSYPVKWLVTLQRSSIGDTVGPSRGSKWKTYGLKILHRYHFSSALKRMSVVAGYQPVGSTEYDYIATVKGAPGSWACTDVSHRQNLASVIVTSLVIVMGNGIHITDLTRSLRALRSPSSLASSAFSLPSPTQLGWTLKATVLHSVLPFSPNYSGLSSRPWYCPIDTKFAWFKNRNPLTCNAPGRPSDYSECRKLSINDPFCSVLQKPYRRCSPAPRSTMSRHI